MAAKADIVLLRRLGGNSKSNYLNSDVMEVTQVIQDKSRFLKGKPSKKVVYQLSISELQKAEHDSGFDTQFIYLRKGKNGVLWMFWQ